MNCPKCNAVLSDSSKFCTHCGTKIEAVAPKQEAPKQEAPKQEEDDEELKQLEAEIRVNLDADYFQWKEGKDGKDKPDKQEGKTKGKSEGIQKAFKNLIGGHQHDDSGM